MLLESIKSFLTHTKPDETVDTSHIIQDLSNEDIYHTGAFFDNVTSNFFSGNKKTGILEKQKAKIMQYRNMSKSPDISDAIEEIVNEISFVISNEEPIKLKINEENKQIQTAINTSFDKVMRLLDIKNNIYNIIKTSYIDGQLVFNCKYNKDVKKGIESISLIEPTYLYLDKSTEKYKYNAKKIFYDNTGIDKSIIFDIEEIVRKDFGIYDGKIILGYLEYAIKSANQLRTLEDLLIPMRFSRSISRRVFNVDIGDLPNKKGISAMQDIQNKFKYKKNYNVETGEVTNQQHITSMVEDYWFANRSGGKGTTVDTIDETGNLGELNDILYFNKKLYKSLFIPSNRISINPDEDKTVDYESTSVTREDIKFFMFISRLRNVYIDSFKQLLKRELISTKVFTEDEYNLYAPKINIYFTNENPFIEKMEIDKFTAKLDIYATASEYQGKLFPVETILHKIFKMNKAEIEKNFNMIESEKTKKEFANFYAEDEF